MKILNIYHSATGNTEKVAKGITVAAEDAGHQVDTVKATPETDVDVLDYDFVFAGSGVYQWMPGKPLTELFSRLIKGYSQGGAIQPGSPKRPGKRVVVYCTYGGPHTGANEAVPAVKWMGQLFDHLGFDIVGEWYIVSEFHGELARMSTAGRLGDITGRPNDEDLRQVAERVSSVTPVRHCGAPRTTYAAGSKDGRSSSGMVRTGLSPTPWKNQSCVVPPSTRKMSTR